MRKRVESEFEQNNRNLPDETLLKIAHVDFDDYEEDALEIVRDEIKTRNLSMREEDQQTDENDTDHHLTKRASSFFPFLMERIAAFTVSQIESLKYAYHITVEDGKDMTLICENACLFLHLFEREARKHVDIQDSNKFSDVLFLNVLYNLFSEYLVDQRATDFIHHMATLYQTRSSAYGSCPDPVATIGEDGDLYQSYANIIMEHFNLEDADNIASEARTQISRQIAQIHMPNLFNGEADAPIVINTRSCSSC
ncbi:MAG: hypothetical protein Q8Q33_09775 [Chlamydiota bacterium]|nr:hypothetical protein [Chlamydiota bacterium]